MRPEGGLSDLIDSVADGTSVDWDRIDPAALDEHERRLLTQLRLVAGLAEVHRSQVDDPAPVVANLPWVSTSGQRWGHLLLIEKIGEGSYGEVYRARDTWLDREVALKLLKPMPGQEAALLRILHEARTLARVRHPNVVTVHGADIHDGRVGLWMEFVPGRTLEDALQTRERFTVAEAVLIGQELCQALAAVHAAGLVHRDVKTRNVIREDGGRVVLMDFGAGQARGLKMSDKAGPTGTPVYLAPEVLSGSEASVRSDIYALGVLLYRLVTARYPVVAVSLSDLRDAHERDDRKPLREVRPDVPEDFVRIVDRALARAPENRYENAMAMHDALAQLFTATTVVPARVAPAARRWLSPRRAIAALAALVIVATAASLAIWRFDRGAIGPTGGVRTLAVLPLRSDAGVQDYFADGMTEALIQELAGVHALRVISRTSVMQFKDTNEAVGAIANRLNAQTVLEGSVLRAGLDVRINVRLIDVRSDTPVWTRTFQERLQNVLALQQDVARSVANELAVALGAGEAARPVQPVNPDAHDAYLRGRYLLNQGTVESVRQAIERFEEATRLDPGNGRARAGIGQAYLLLGAYYNAMPREEGLQRAREAVLKALSVDKQLADAHAVLAEILFEHDWDWADAEREFKLALDQNPSLEYARERYAMFLAGRARLDDALAEIAEARRVDPLSPVIASSTGGILRYARRYDEAVAEYDRVLARHPDLLSALIGRARTLSAMGRYDEAIARYRELIKRGVNEPFFITEIAQADAAAGRVDQAMKAIEDLRRKQRTAGWFVPPESYAYVYARLGDTDEAFKWLDEAFRTRSGLVLWLAVDARIDPLRHDRRFNQYLERLGVKP
jgi:serine/threonine-protein kinase